MVGSGSSVKMYDPLTNTWTSKANMDMEFAGHGSGVVNGKIYLFGGGFTVGCFSEGAVYDPNATIYFFKKAKSRQGEFIAQPGDPRAVCV